MLPLHSDEVRPATALEHDRDDGVRWVLDVAGLALHAVWRVDRKRPVCPP